MSEQIASIAEERGSQAVLGSSRAAIAEPPRSALPAFSEKQAEALAELSAYIAPAPPPPVLPGNPGESFSGSPLAGDIALLAGALRGADILSKSSLLTDQRAAAQRHPSICAAKRCLDLTIAITALILLAPILLLCALAIRLDSPGPIFFRQKRVGRGGAPFSIIKFRSMQQGAAGALEKYLESDHAAREEWNRTKKLRRDPRVTHLGRFLRRFSLDELPQLWNVVTGDMSAVGPRPIQSSEIPLYAECYLDYCAVRPGLTGLWQVSGRSDASYQRRVFLDSKYVRGWSFATDLEILLRTAPAVVKASGAY